MKKKNHESRYVQYARLTYQLTKMVLPRYRHRNSPHTYTQPQLVACVFLGFYVDRSYWDMEEWLLASETICQVLELQEVPNYSTLCRTFQQLPMCQLRLLMRKLLRWLGDSESAMVVDSTGLMTRLASQHYLSRTGRVMSDYAKAFYVAGVDSQYIVGWYYTRGPYGADAQYLNLLRAAAHPYGIKQAGRREWILLGDKGFEGAQTRADDLIAPRQGQHRVVREDRRVRLDLTSQARLDGFLGQRWKIETIISVMKRKSGDTLRSFKARLHPHEVALKVLVYNLHRHLAILLFLLVFDFATEQLIMTYFFFVGYCCRVQMSISFAIFLDWLT